MPAGNSGLSDLPLTNKPAVRHPRSLLPLLSSLLHSPQLHTFRHLLILDTFPRGLAAASQPLSRDFATGGQA